MPDQPHPAATLIESWYAAALAAVAPEPAVRQHLRRTGRTLSVAGQPVPINGRLIVVAVGKAAPAMTDGAIAACGDLISAGIIITKDGHATAPPPAGFALHEAAHPVPDDRGVAATRNALSLVRDLGRTDVVLALTSGGGSALFEAPRPPLTLVDLARTTDLLLRAGAPIQDLNAVRTPLSLVKGGGFRQAAGPARMLTLILSDVLGNDPRVIASGPTIPGQPDPAAALAVLDRFGLRDQVPPAVLTTLQALPPPAPAEPEGARSRRDFVGSARSFNAKDVSGRRDNAETAADIVTIVGDNDRALTAALAAVAAAGLHGAAIWHHRQGEAADLGRAWVAACRDADPALDVLLGGGEATVTVRGDGTGGRNTEFALAAALALEQVAVGDWLVASLATDGQDGPTDAAGAWVDAATATLIRHAGIDPGAALDRNDSLTALDAAGRVIRPGPTGTNVNDLYFAVRTRPQPARSLRTGSGVHSSR